MSTSAVSQAVAMALRTVKGPPGRSSTPAGFHQLELDVHPRLDRAPTHTPTAA